MTSGFFPLQLANKIIHALVFLMHTTCSSSPGNPSTFLNRTHAFKYSQFFTATIGVVDNGDVGVVPQAIN
jgi:hypothetical protein